MDITHHSSSHPTTGSSLHILKFYTQSCVVPICDDTTPQGATYEARHHSTLNMLFL